MKAELEGLILAREALLEARSGDEAKHVKDLYRTRLDEVLKRFPNLSRRTLELIIERAHLRWCKAQDKPSSIPPKA